MTERIDTNRKCPYCDVEEKEANTYDLPFEEWISYCDE